MPFIVQGRRTVLGIGVPEAVSQFPTRNQHTLPRLPTSPALAKLELGMRSELGFSQVVLYCLLGG